MSEVDQDVEGSEPTVSPAKELAELLEFVNEREALQIGIKRVQEEAVKAQEELGVMRARIRELETLISTNSMSLQGLMNNLKLVIPSKKRAAPKAKWRHPTDPNKTWTGRGYRPLWAKDVELVPVA
jgi:DNA-binding protein H-NS